MENTDNNYHILIVDDAEINRSMLSDMLSADYAILEADNGLEAISLLKKHHADISLVLLDIIMPEMDGFEVLSLMGRSEWLSSIPVIMISAETSSSSIDKAYDLGATDYINRPFDEKTIQRRVKNTIMLYAKQKTLEGMVTQQVLEKEQNNFLMVEILSHIVEFRNGESGLHVLHIRTVTDLLLRHLVQMTDRYPLTPTDISLIVNASSLHDIGKISIPETILNKPGKLSAEEFDIVKTHCAIGAQILENTPCRQNEALVRAAHDICRWHHERYDGGGYPDGLRGDEIPISAQAVAMADVYDALTNERVYKPAYPHDVAMRMINRGECGAFNPLLLQCLNEIGPRVAAEMAKRTQDQISTAEVSNISTQILSSGKASSRTLALLEQERTKYQFFASMSKEIQFEYTLGTDLLTISDWGAAHLGLREIMTHPIQDKHLTQVLPSRDLTDLFHRLQRAVPENPIVHATYMLNVGGASRWFKVVARPLWVEDGQAAMTGCIGKFLDIHEERMQLEALRQKAEQDSLTHLRNHMAARKKIEALLSQGSARNYALILFDLDFFKLANDARGHMFGDTVLKVVARRIVGTIGEDAIASRIGGDEFLVFTSCESGAETFAARLFEAIRGSYEGFEISVSMGIAISQRNTRDYDLLFHQADQALYAAKKQGRKQYQFYNPSVEGALSVLSPMESELGRERS